MLYTATYAKVSIILKERQIRGTEGSGLGHRESEKEREAEWEHGNH